MRTVYAVCHSFKNFQNATQIYDDVADWSKSYCSRMKTTACLLWMTIKTELSRPLTGHVTHCSTNVSRQTPWRHLSHLDDTCHTLMHIQCSTEHESGLLPGSGVGNLRQRTGTRQLNTVMGSVEILRNAVKLSSITGGMQFILWRQSGMDSVDHSNNPCFHII